MICSRMKGNLHGSSWAEEGGHLKSDGEKKSVCQIWHYVKNICYYQRQSPSMRLLPKARRQKRKYRAEHEQGIILREAAARSTGSGADRQQTQHPDPPKRNNEKATRTEKHYTV